MNPPYIRRHSVRGWRVRRHLRMKSANLQTHAHTHTQKYGEQKPWACTPRISWGYALAEPVTHSHRPTRARLVRENYTGTFYRGRIVKKTHIHTYTHTHTHTHTHTRARLQTHQAGNASWLTVVWLKKPRLAMYALYIVCVCMSRVCHLLKRLPHVREGGRRAWRWLHWNLTGVLVVAGWGVTVSHSHRRRSYPLRLDSRRNRGPCWAPTAWPISCALCLGIFAAASLCARVAHTLHSDAFENTVESIRSVRASCPSHGENTPYQDIKNPGRL